MGSTSTTARPSSSLQTMTAIPLVRCPDPKRLKLPIESNRLGHSLSGNYSRLEILLTETRVSRHLSAKSVSRTPGKHTVRDDHAYPGNRTLNFTVFHTDWGYKQIRKSCCEKRLISSVGCVRGSKWLNRCTHAGKPSSPPETRSVDEGHRVAGGR
jgi:hypothetical protein